MSRRQQHQAWREEARSRAELTPSRSNHLDTSGGTASGIGAVEEGPKSSSGRRQRLAGSSPPSSSPVGKLMHGSSSTPNRGASERQHPSGSPSASLLGISSQRKSPQNHVGVAHIIELRPSSTPEVHPTEASASQQHPKDLLDVKTLPTALFSSPVSSVPSPAIAAHSTGAGTTQPLVSRGHQSLVELSAVKHALRESEDRERRLEGLCLNLEAHVVELTQELDQAVAKAASTISHLEREKHELACRFREQQEELVMALSREKKLLAEAKLPGPTLSDVDRDAKQRHVVKVLRDELTAVSEHRRSLMEELESLKMEMNEKNERAGVMALRIDELERKVLEIGLRKTTPPPSPDVTRRRPPSPTRGCPPPIQIKDFVSVPVVALRPVVAQLGAPFERRIPSPTAGVVRNSSPSVGRPSFGTSKQQSPTPRGTVHSLASAPQARQISSTGGSSNTDVKKPPSPRALSPSLVRQQLATATFLQATQSARQRLEGLNRPNVMARPRIAITSSPIARKTVLVTHVAAGGTTSSVGPSTAASSVPMRQTRVTPVRTSSPFRSATFETTFRPTRLVRHNDWNEPS